MGTWGSGILDDDLSNDVEAAFAEFLAAGLTCARATRQLERDYAEVIRDKDEGPSFWLALAVAQHVRGLLSDGGKVRALAIIDGDVGLERWKDDAATLRRRKKVLTQLRKLLVSAQPPKTKRSGPAKQSHETFGGLSGGSTPVEVNDGALFNPVKRTWRSRPHAATFSWWAARNSAAHRSHPTWFTT